MTVRFLINTILRFMGQAPEIPSPPNMIDFDDVSFEKDENGKTGTLTIKNIPVPFYAETNPFKYW